MSRVYRGRIAGESREDRVCVYARLIGPGSDRAPADTARRTVTSALWPDVLHYGHGIIALVRIMLLERHYNLIRRE